MKLEYYRTPCGHHSTDISAAADDFPQMESVEQCPSTTSHQPNFRSSHHSSTSGKHPNSFFLPSFSKSSSLLFTLLTIACLLLTITTAASSSSSSSSSRPEDQSTTITQQQHQQHLLRQFRHRLHSQQYRRHHYYSALLHSSRKTNYSPTTPTTPTTSTSTSSTSTSSLYNHLKVPSSVWSRHRSHHYYHHHRYYHYDHDELQLKNKSRNGGDDEETELISQSAPSATFRWSARSASARLLREHSSPPTTSAPPPAIKVIYQSNWITSDDQLPVCEPKQVCNKVDIYSTPWIEKQCRCPVTGTNYRPCSESLNANDGHTVVEKTKLYKTCEPVRSLPTCKDFYNITWTITTTSAKKNHLGNSLYNSLKSNAQEGSSSSSSSSSSTSSDNITRQEMRCRCPAGSVAYIKSHNVHKEGDGTLAYQYHFVCSPETKLRCKRKEPCRLFTTRRRSKVEEVNTNNLCQCPGGYTCPTNHRHPSVLAGSGTSGSPSSASHNFSDSLRTYSAFCYLDSDKLLDDTESRDHPHHHQKTMTTETTSDEVTEGKLRSQQHHHPADYKDSTENQQQQQYHFSLLNR